jgi:hypothetical protein
MPRFRRSNARDGLAPWGLFAAAAVLLFLPESCAPFGLAANRLSAADTAEKKAAEPSDGEESDETETDAEAEAAMEAAREIHMEYLKGEGYRPRVDKEGDVSFKVEGGNYYIEIGKDEKFFKVVYPAFYEIGSVDEHARVLRQIERINREVKVVKMYLVENFVCASAESFVPDQESATHILDRCLAALQYGSLLFEEGMAEK